MRCRARAPFGRGAGLGAAAVGERRGLPRELDDLGRPPRGGAGPPLLEVRLPGVLVRHGSGAGLVREDVARAREAERLRGDVRDRLHDDVRGQRGAVRRRQAAVVAVVDDEDHLAARGGAGAHVPELLLLRRRALDGVVPHGGADLREAALRRAFAQQGVHRRLPLLLSLATAAAAAHQPSQGERMLRGGASKWVGRAFDTAATLARLRALHLDSSSRSQSRTRRQSIKTVAPCVPNPLHTTPGRWRDGGALPRLGGGPAGPRAEFFDELPHDFAP